MFAELFAVKVIWSWERSPELLAVWVIRSWKRSSSFSSDLLETFSWERFALLWGRPGADGNVRDARRVAVPAVDDDADEGALQGPHHGDEHRVRRTSTGIGQGLERDVDAQLDARLDVHPRMPSEHELPQDPVQASGNDHRRREGEGWGRASALGRPR